MRMKPVKIVATTGPSSDNYETVLALVKAGVDVFRINLSHATQEEIDNRFEWIRKAEKEAGRPIAIMGDLAGPKIRIEEIVEGTEIVKGDKVTIVRDHIVGNKERFSLNYSDIIDMIEPGAEIYVDDGAIKLRAEKKTKEGIEAVVTVGGPLLSRKGFLAEGIALSKTGISDKDKKSIKLMVEMEVDALALSFVQTADDVIEVKNLLPKNSPIMTVAKIETAGGVDNAESILEVADALMVARGDMGLAVPMAKVPHIQKELINLCLKKSKPVITATQMLESMVSRSIPTRAEVTDVANAILDGTDCVMLSAETARGQFPVEVVETMSNIIKEAVKHRDHFDYKEHTTISHAVSAAAGNIADQIGAELIVAFTESGRCARNISRHRHKEQIIAASPNPASVRKLNFTWGVYPLQIKATKDFEDFRKQANQIATNNPVHQLQKGQPFVIVAGMPFGEVGTTNMIFVQKAE
jgi:pyruvate kinase